MNAHCRLLSLALLSALLVACGEDKYYAYQPLTSAQVEVAGRIGADYPVPPESPRGDVRVATFGVSELTAEEDEGATLNAIHVRLIVANNDDAPWTVDTREQRVALSGRGESRPAFASADTGSAPPIVTIAAGSKRTIDLFFPLPADLEDAGDLPAFDAIWKVQTTTRAVTERTPFERLTVEPRYYSTYGWNYGGPPYWYDPYYPHGAWIGVRWRPIYVGHPVVIHRPHYHPARPVPRPSPPSRRAPGGPGRRH